MVFIHVLEDLVKCMYSNVFLVDYGFLVLAMANRWRQRKEIGPRSRHSHGKESVLLGEAVLVWIGTWKLRFSKNLLCH